MKTIALFAAAAGITLSLAAPATASTRSIERTVHVDTSDLDLSQAKDRAKLERRVDIAARSVCGFGQTSVRSIDQAAARACYDEAKAKAQLRIAAIEQELAKGG